MLLYRFLFIKFYKVFVIVVLNYYKKKRLEDQMSRFQVSQVGGDDCEKKGIENPAMDPVELNVYGLYSKRNSVTCAMQGELKRKSSSGFTHITRFDLNFKIFIIVSDKS